MQCFVMSGEAEWDAGDVDHESITFFSILNMNKKDKNEWKRWMVKLEVKVKSCVENWILGLCWLVERMEEYMHANNK